MKPLRTIDHGRKPKHRKLVLAVLATVLGFGLGQPFDSIVWNHKPLSYLATVLHFNAGGNR